MRILLVDDSAAVLEAVQEMLSEIPGLEIIGMAQTVAEAIEVAQTLRPEGVILDLHMPGGSGFDVLKAAKSLVPPPIVIMFTSFPSPQLRQFALRAGADYFLDKSKELEKLLELCRGLSFDSLTDLS